MPPGWRSVHGPGSPVHVVNRSLLQFSRDCRGCVYGRHHEQAGGRRGGDDPRPGGDGGRPSRRARGAVRGGPTGGGRGGRGVGLPFDGALGPGPVAGRSGGGAPVGAPVAGAVPGAVAERGDRRATSRRHRPGVGGGDRGPRARAGDRRGGALPGAGGGDRPGGLGRGRGVPGEPRRDSRPSRSGEGGRAVDRGAGPGRGGPRGGRRARRRAADRAAGRRVAGAQGALPRAGGHPADPRGVRRAVRSRRGGGRSRPRGPLRGGAARAVRPGHGPGRDRGECGAGAPGGSRRDHRPTRARSGRPAAPAPRGPPPRRRRSSRGVPNAATPITCTTGSTAGRPASRTCACCAPSTIA